MGQGFILNTVYRATEGEGLRIGTPQIFVRFQGCAVGCLNCDSKETWSFEGKEETLDEVMNKIHDASSEGSLKRVSITGGDPLHPKHTDNVLLLVKKLKEEGYFINIEAAGTRVVPEIFDELDYISFDYKPPSTGVRYNKKIIGKLLDSYAHKSQIKSVVFDRHDFEAYYDLYSEYKNHPNFRDDIWVITPCYEPGEEFPLRRFLDVVKWNEDFGGPFRVIGQQHKWLHGPVKKNV